MKKVLIIAIATALTLTVSGCGALDFIKDKLNVAETETTVNTVDENVKDEPSNSITVGVFDFDTFNPLTSQSETVREAMELVYEPLFELDNEMRIVPLLAESYGASADGRVIRVNLKQGVKWHDGSGFNAFDVAYTMKNILNGSTVYTDALSNVANYKIIDDYIIEITLRKSVPNFPALLTFPIVKYQTPINVNAGYTPIGTGPFKFDGKLSTDKMQLSAYEEYHDGRAMADNAFIVFAPDSDRYRSMFEASEIDVITSNTVDLTQYMPKGGIKISKFITDKLTFLGYNTQSEKLFGAQTRVGLSQFINKDEIISSVLYSHAVAVDAPINPSAYLYHTDKTVFSADDISARECLASDGWELNSSGTYTRLIDNKRQTLLFKLLVNGESAEKVGVANKIAEYFNKFGVWVTVDAVPYEQYVARVNTRDFDIFIGEMELGANLDISALVGSDGNYFSYLNGDIDTLTAQIGMTSSEDEQKVLFEQLVGIMERDMPFVPLYYREGSVLYGAKIKSGINPSVSAFYRSSGKWSTKE